MGAILGWAAGNARYLLVAGLVAGCTLPQAAALLKPWLPEMVAGLLFIAALRIGPRQAMGALRELPAQIGYVLLIQIAAPVAAILAFLATGTAPTQIAIALVLMLAASPISGSPNLSAMTGNDPAPALRLVIIGTALLPLTVLAPFWLLPVFGSPETVLAASARLLLTIAGAAAAAFTIRHFAMPDPRRETLQAIDGASAIAMAIVVIGLMSEVGPALTERPAAFLFWLGLASLINFGCQLLVAGLLAGKLAPARRAASAIVAGNRNIALFLVALPPEITDPLLLFIGCYQIPMYLTPIVMRRLYRPPAIAG